MNTINNIKKVYKTNLRLVFSIFCITLTTLMINIISSVSEDMLPKALSTTFWAYFFREENKFYVLTILFLANVTLGYAQLIYFFAIGGRKWIIKQFIPTIFYALFSGRINHWKSSPDSSKYLDNNWYRVTCYKYIDKSATPVHFLYEYLKRSIFRKKYRERKIKFDNGYLVCFYRYGMEKKCIQEDYTSVIYQVKTKKKLEGKEDVRGIAGLTYIGDDDKVQSLDHNINSILEKVIAAAQKKGVKNLLYDKEIESEGIEKNIKKMLDALDALKPELDIEKSEINKIVNFMRGTNTDFNSMFGISQGKHSDHFVGFCIKGKKEMPWGVVVIDAHEEVPAAFWEIICPKTKLEPGEKHIMGEEWLDCTINSYMGILSSSISRVIFEREV